MSRTRAVLALALAIPTASAHAADNGTVAGIEARLRHLRSELDQIKQNLARRQAAVAQAQAVATEARAEARRAEQRANALALAPYSGRSFTTSSTSVLGSEAAPPPSSSINGLGGHAIGTAGQQRATPIGEYGRFQVGAVSIQLGAIFDATAIVRTRNEVADLTSSWNAIPFAQSPLYHEPEFRGSARGSRFAIFIEGQPAAATRVAGYVETDFQSSGISSNSNESNSYTLRVRQAYGTLDRNDLHFHLLAGQAWSLLTLNRIGITPRQEQVPLTIDSGYVPGFNYTRQEQLRFSRDFDNRRLWLGLSFESPATSYYVNNANSTGVIGGTPNYTNPGGSLLNSTANYSDEIAPDVIGKIAFDPSFGHYELDGLARFFHDRVTATVANRSGRDNTVLAGGVGGGLILPIVGPKLTVQASGLVGQGIGRYGVGQLPDATISSNGSPIPLPEVQALIGAIYHPTPRFDLFAYVGTEQIGKRSFNEVNGRTLLSYGYGNGNYSDAGCNTEGSALACVANTRGITQGTLGGFWRFLHGPFGTLQVGTSWAYTQRTAFSGLGATRGSIVTPKTDENVIMFSFRYLPFL